MCAIVGIFAYRAAAASVERGELVRIRDHMAARGPDGKGAWFSNDGRIGLGHRRLSIIDLSETAAQPMLSVDSKCVVTFNGEIYNFRALRQQLETRGYIFRTQSDTEVLLHLYAEKGEEMVHDLRGMFAFAIWDCERRALLLARDPYGIKPLYYADDGRTLRFASQVKALLAGGEVSRDPEPAGWVGFYLFGSVPEPHTIHREIRALPAGSTLWIDASRPREPRRYFSIAETYCGAETDRSHRNHEDAQVQVREALLDSVRHHLVADVPVGAFLSAGVDSGALVGLMRDVGQDDVQTVTLAFEEFRGKHDDEAPLAERVARQYGTRHTTRIVTEREFRDELPKIMEAMDQPTIDGVNTWLVSKATRELGLKVAISGLGGDELLGGYSTFFDIPRWVRMLALPARVPGSGRAFHALMTGLALLVRGLRPKIAGMLDFGGTYTGAYLLRRGLFLPWELPTVIEDPGFVRDGLIRLSPVRHIDETLAPCPRTPFGKVATLESSLYMRNQLLRDTDWASMAHSLEVRLPLVDAQLLRRMAPIVAGTRLKDGKACLATSPRTPLPPDIVARRKTGFGTPVEAWQQRNARLQTWDHIPALADSHCPWARRWAYHVVAA